MRRALALLTLSTVAILGLAAPSVAAARAPRTTATLSVSSAGSSTTSASVSPSVGASLVFTGCGYQPGVGVTVSVQSPSAVSFFGAVAGQDGCFSTASTESYVANDAGSYTASSYQSGNRRAAATATFTVAG